MMKNIKKVFINTTKILCTSILISCLFLTTKIAVDIPLSVKAATNFGYDTIGSSNQSISFADDLRGNRYTATDNLTIDLARFYCMNTVAEAHFKVVIVDNATGAIIPNGISNPGTVPASTPSWQTVTFGTSPNLTAGNLYYIFIISDSGNTRYYYNVSGSYNIYIDYTNSYASPANPGSLTTSSLYRMSLYLVADYYGPQTVETVSASPGDHTANLTGNVTSLGGGANITSRGFDYWITGEATANVSESGNWGIGAYTLEVTGLSSNTTYNYKAWAINDSQINYGDTENFTTTGVTPTVPEVTSISVSNIGQTSCTVTGNITSDGNDTVTKVYARYSDFSVLNSTVNASASIDVTVTQDYEIGLFTVNLTDLVPGFTYYVKTGAENIAGVAFSSNEIEFTTSDNITAPAATISAGSITSTSANITGTVVSSNVTRAFGNPMTSETNPYGGWISLSGEYSMATTWNTHTAAANETVIQYGLITKLTGATSETYFALYEWESPNVTSKLSDITHMDIPNGIITNTWVYSDVADIPLVEGTTYCIMTGNITSTYMNKTTSPVGYWSYWGTDEVFPEDGSIGFNHQSVNKYNMIAFYNSTINVTSWRVDYGTATGNYTANVSGSGNQGLGDISLSLSSLTPDTTYYVRFAIYNASGWGYSDEISFTTDASPVAPTSGTAEVVRNILNNALLILIVTLLVVVILGLISSGNITIAVLLVILIGIMVVFGILPGLADLITAID